MVYVTIYFVTCAKTVVHLKPCLKNSTSTFCSPLWGRCAYLCEWWCAKMSRLSEVHRLSFLSVPIFPHVMRWITCQVQMRCEFSDATEELVFCHLPLLSRHIAFKSPGWPHSLPKLSTARREVELGAYGAMRGGARWITLVVIEDLNSPLTLWESRILFRDSSSWYFSAEQINSYFSTSGIVRVGSRTVDCNNSLSSSELTLLTV